jgi:predicted acylesterase/phospholipase RssA
LIDIKLCDVFPRQALTMAFAPINPLQRAGTVRALTLSGGGFLGLYTAMVLAGLEERFGEPLGRRFDLLAGTSIGGVLALALAFEVPMARLVALFIDRGSAVFSSRDLPRGALGCLIDLGRSMIRPKYSGRALRAALHAELGQRRLADASHRVVVPAVDVRICQTKVFKTPHAPASLGDGECSAVDVAMASCAAPAYFPSVRIGRSVYADGGLFAVAPDQIALHEVEHFLGIPGEKVRMLSIGTAVTHYRPSGGVREDAGAVGWLSEGRLVLTMLSAQQQHVQAMLEGRLGARYLRVDADWPAGAGLGIDVATPEAVELLCAMAQKTLRNAEATLLRRFFD